MNMLRALIALFVLFVVGRLLARLLRSGTAPERRSGNAPVTRMIRCARCGTFVPEGEAVVDGGLEYCSDEHRRLGQGPQA